MPAGVYGAKGGWTLFVDDDVEDDPEGVALRGAWVGGGVGGRRPWPRLSVLIGIAIRPSAAYLRNAKSLLPQRCAPPWWACCSSKAWVGASRAWRPATSAARGPSSGAGCGLARLGVLIDVIAADRVEEKAPAHH